MQNSMKKANKPARATRDCCIENLIAVVPTYQEKSISVCFAHHKFVTGGVFSSHFHQASLLSGCLLSLIVRITSPEPGRLWAISGGTARRRPAAGSWAYCQAWWPRQACWAECALQLARGCSLAPVSAPATAPASRRSGAGRAPQVRKPAGMPQRLQAQERAPPPEQRERRRQHLSDGGLDTVREL